MHKQLYVQLALIVQLAQQSHYYVNLDTTKQTKDNQVAQFVMLVVIVKIQE